MWKRHWKLSRDPFLGPGTPYVPTPSHDEAVARLAHTIETIGRLAILRAPAGLGKSTVLSRALAESRSPSRRIAHIVAPPDGVSLLDGLTERLGLRVPSSRGRSFAWKGLGDAVRLCRFQGLHVVLAIDDCHGLTSPFDRLHLERLTHLDPHPGARLTILQVGRTLDDRATVPGLAPWELAIRLEPMTRGDVEHYVAAKLADAGRDQPAFTPLALHRLHLLSEGIPRGLDRLASLAMMAGAMRGLEIITPDVIEGVARECTCPARALLEPQPS